MLDSDPVLAPRTNTAAGVETQQMGDAIARRLFDAAPSPAQIGRLVTIAAIFASSHADAANRCSQSPVELIP